MTWFWIVLAFVVGLAAGAVTALAIEQAEEVDFGPGDDWWI